MPEAPDVGVAQGTPISPPLSILPITRWQSKHPEIEMYADDGVLLMEDIETYEKI
jgi:hypothetical protein